MAKTGKGSRPYRKKTDYCGTRIYRIWANMKNRCYNKNDVYKYSRYGGRGIRVCDDWLKFKPFLEWALSSGYALDLTIDRIDNSGDYSPENCRWVTMSEQNKNRSTTHLVTFNGETKCVKDWMRELHVGYHKIIEMEAANNVKNSLA